MVPRTNHCLTVALAASALMALAPAQPAQAAGVDGGVTFTDVVPTAGITYGRTPSPRKAVRDAIDAGPRIPIATFPDVRANTPQKERGAPGIAIFDYDRDGDLDLYVTNGPGTANSLFQSQLAQTGSLTFIDRAATAGVTAVNQDSGGVCFGDIDNDGDDDLFVVGLPADYPTPVLDGNHLFRNNGNGTFTDITTASGTTGVHRHSSGCSMGDVNGDGRLDIYVTNTYDDWKQRQPVMGAGIDLYPGLEPNELYVNGGGNVFTEEAAARGLQTYDGLASNATYSWAPALVDYDLDGDVDAMEADTQGAMGRLGAGYNRLFENDGTGHFTDVSLTRGLTQPGSWMGLSFGDYNCDGSLDFFSTNTGFMVGGPPNLSRWFLGSASKSFTDPGVGALVGTPFGWGTSTFDFDNDGDQDIVWFGEDDILQFNPAENLGTLLRNTGSCSANFAWVGTGVLKNSQYRQVQGVATGDVNNDGFDDVLSVAGFVLVSNPANALPVQVILGGLPGTPWDAVAKAELMYTGRLPDGTLPMPITLGSIPHTINPGDLAVEVNSANNGNRWATVRLLGAKGLSTGGKVNRSGIGAVIRSTPFGGGPVSLHPVLGGASYGSENSLEAVLGLGDATKGKVEVLWPGGVKNVLYGALPGERILFPEIPCNYNLASWARPKDLEECVDKSLLELQQKGLITSVQRQRFFDSARMFTGRLAGAF